MLTATLSVRPIAGPWRASLEADRAAVLDHPDLTPEQRRRELDGLDRALQRFAAIVDPASAQGQWRMTPRAVEGALFIMVYRDEPMLQLPYRLLESLIAIDEALTLWRYRHALMVRRMLGVKTGTGGSSGHDYLREGAERMKLFPDLIQLSSYLIPRSKLPVLPVESDSQTWFCLSGGSNRVTVLDLSTHFSHYRSVAGRAHLAAHSHHYWPDVTREAQLLAWDEACRHADDKWGPIFTDLIPAVQRGIAAILRLPDPSSIAFAPNTHDFVRRLPFGLADGATGTRADLGR